jgi:hypothetical protein
VLEQRGRRQGKLSPLSEVLGQRERAERQRGDEERRGVWEERV